MTDAGHRRPADDDPDRDVADARPELLRTALLLTGDPEAAEELVQRALAAVGVRRGRRAAAVGDPADVGDPVRRRMVADLAGRRALLRPAAQVLDAAPWPGPGAGQRLVDALLDLPPRTRAVAVLRWYEDRDPGGAARLAGCPEGEARSAGALRELAAALDPPDAGGPAAGPPQVRVAAALTALAGRPVRWRLSGDAAVADARGRRRRAALLRSGAVLGATVLVAVVAPGIRAPADRPAGPAAPDPTGGAADRPAPAPDVPVLVGLPRGSLAGDARFLEAVRRVGWGGVPAPPPDARRVVLATDTPHGRAALVVGEVDGRLRGVWLTGRRGAPAGDLAVHEPARLDPERPALTVVGGPGPASLVVVAAPGDGVEVSDRLRVGPGGTVSREYEPVVPSADGTTVAEVRTTSGGSAVSVRVVRDGRAVFRSGADPPPATGGARAPELRALRPAGRVPDPGLVAAALAAVGAPLGAEPADLDPDLLWSAELPRSGGFGSVAVLVARSPGGGLVVPTVLGIGPPGAVRAGVCGTSTPPGGTDVAGLAVARSCDLTTMGLGTGDDPVWLVVSMPPAAVGADVLDGDGRVLTTLELESGGTVTRLPDGGAEVSAHDRGGRPVATVPIAPTAAEPFGDYGDGRVS